MPKVSIGMPVFNGENYIEEAISSILAQSFTDFELIISDNASSDATEEICRRFATNDARVRYYRAEKNHGASWNHQFVIDQATAELFKLAAHDDVCLPDQLQRCVDALEANPDSILAYTQTWMMQGDQKRMQLYSDAVDLQSKNTAIRFGDLIDEAPPAFPVFGVMRLASLRSIPGFDPYKGSDRVVLVRLALLGSFVEVQEPLFQYRWHDGNASNLMASGHGFYTWWNPKKGLGRVYPDTRLAWEYLRSIFIVKLDGLQRKQCLREWWRWCTLKRSNIVKEWGQIFGAQPAFISNDNMIQRALKRQLRANFKASVYSDYPQPSDKNE